MSIPVKIHELAAAVAGRAYAYLVTVGDDSRPHVVAVTPRVDADSVVVETGGRRTRANAGARQHVTLVYPPPEDGGYSLIVDAGATVDGDALRLTPTSAVLHRRATPSSAPSATGCGSDCQPVAAAEHDH